MYACTTCRAGSKTHRPACVSKGHHVVQMGKRLTIPKKNNVKAWNKIRNGDLYWDDKKALRDPSRKKWFDDNVTIESNGSWTLLSYMSEEWKKRVAERLKRKWQ